MKKIFTLFVALTAIMSLNAEPMFMKNTWDGAADWSWKEMAVDAENGTWVLDNVVFGGGGVDINTTTSDDGKRYVPAASIQAFKIPGYEEVAIEAGDIVMFIYDPQEYSQYDPDNQSGVMALVYGKAMFAKNNWENGDWSWKRMEITEFGTYQLHRVIFGNGGGVNLSPLANDACADNRFVEVAKISAYTVPGYAVATLEAGDDIDLIYDPEEYSQYDPTKSGMQALIWDKWNTPKTFLKHKWDGANWFWKKMDRQEDGTFALANTLFNGDGFNLNDKIEDESSRWIPTTSIKAYINFEEAELAAGDSAMFIYDPESYDQYQPAAKSGMSAIINYKAGYALRSTWGGTDVLWKNMTQDPEDDDWWVLENSIYDGKDFEIVIGNQITEIKAENVQAYINYEEAELAAGDSVMFVFRPSMVNAHNPKESGLYAMITKKNGYAIRGTWGKESASWKNLADDGDGAFFVDNVLFDGQNVQVLAKDELYNIKPENITAIDYATGEKFELEAGDIVVFSFDPETRSQYDEKQSGLWAVLIQKHGYALQSFWGEVQTSWKEMTADDGKWVLFDALLDGHDLYINNFAGSLGARKIEAKNIQGYVDSEFAEWSAGDSVIFIFDPETYSQYDPKASGLSAMITKKNGYAIKYEGAWKNMIDDDPEDHDWWIFENALFNGANVQILNGKEIRSIEPKNIEAYINYDFAELSAGDSVFYVFRPSLYNRYVEAESGMYAHITKKAGYALKGTWGEKVVSWKNMTLDAEQEDETYLLNEVIFDGKDVDLISEEGIRTIKVENILALMLNDYSEAELEEGDLVMFVYTPDTYASMDPSQPGLMALIIDKGEPTAVQNISTDTKAVKVMMNGQMLIIKNGKTYNVLGVEVK